MAIIKQQLGIGNSILFGKTENEFLSQFFSIGRDFSLSSIILTFNNSSIDSVRDVDFKIEVRLASGANYLLDLLNDSLATSESYTDTQLMLPVTSFEFDFTPAVDLDAGEYWFSLINTDRSSCGANVSANSSTFIDNFIHIKNGSGIYRTDLNLTYIINGTFSGGTSYNEVTLNQYTNYYLADET